jgi:hypothetical protein
VAYAPARSDVVERSTPTTRISGRSVSNSDRFDDPLGAGAVLT